MASDLKIGDIVALRVICLGNPIGTLGVVFHEYELGPRTGVQVIFRNGEYDGFGEDEQESLLNYVAHNKELENYQFTNVMKLSEDFRKGHFKSVFLME